jgi:hypothetical protein
MATIFDRYLAIRDKEGIPGVHETLDMLDEMLTNCRIEHSFILPNEETIKKYPNTILNLCYSDEDNMTVNLVYALYAKLYREAEDRKLAKALVKAVSRYIDPVCEIITEENDG